MLLLYFNCMFFIQRVPWYQNPRPNCSSRGKNKQLSGKKKRVYIFVYVIIILYLRYLNEGNLRSATSTAFI